MSDDYVVELVVKNTTLVEAYWGREAGRLRERCGFGEYTTQDGPQFRFWTKSEPVKGFGWGVYPS